MIPKQSASPKTRQMSQSPSPLTCSCVSKEVHAAHAKRSSRDQADGQALDTWACSTHNSSSNPWKMSRPSTRGYPPPFTSRATRRVILTEAVRELDFVYWQSYIEPLRRLR